MLSFFQNTLLNCYHYCVGTTTINDIVRSQVDQKIATLPHEIQYEIATQLEKQLQLGVNKGINLSAEKQYIQELLTLLNKKNQPYSETDFLTNENIEQFYQAQETKFNDKKRIIGDVKAHPTDFILSYMFGCDHFATLPKGKAAAQLLKRQIAIDELDESINAARDNPTRILNDIL
ncbi:hypothetical protein [Candidatus Berkiella aquae]|uniref:Uncharacterized protein n=1 Tax=Candidatus Berkiella aquae TaxID=295108 RepID=A0A0Q9YZT7_9GAMM|nr:hypothetical protein [Candidatus Berkiella aquae]MCS5710555.1 hypothetical protein [Candidatus Berkiella aquae]